MIHEFFWFVEFTTKLCRVFSKRNVQLSKMILLQYSITKYSDVSDIWQIWIQNSYDKDESDTCKNTYSMFDKG